MKKLLVSLWVLLSVFVFYAATLFGASLVYEIKTQNVAVNDTATKLPTTPLVGREYLLITNKESTVLYIGNDSVTSSIGTPLGINDTYYGEWKSTIDIFGIVASGGGTNVTVEEGK